MRTERAAIVVAIVGALVARMIGHFSLGDVPHVMDEIAYSLQARTMATGHLSTAVHLPRGAFAQWFVDDRTATFGIFPPGWPVVLSLGYLLGFAAWVNPILHGVTTWVVGRAAGLVDRRATLLASIAWGLSPQALLLGAGFMSHALVALAASVILLIGLSIVTTPATPRAAAVAGTALAFAATARPICGVALGLTLVAFGLRARANLRAKHLLVAALPVAIGLALLGLYNRQLTGSALLFPQTSFFDGHAPPLAIDLFQYGPGCNRLGFGPGHGCERSLPDGDFHTLWGACLSTWRNLVAWFLLAGGGPLVFGFAIAGLVRRRSWSTTVPVVILATVLLYALYWYGGTSYGARFFHAALPTLLVLAALGVAWLGEKRRAFAIVAGVVWLGWNAVCGVGAVREISTQYWGTDARFAQAAERMKGGPPALVLVAFTSEPLVGHHYFTTYMDEVVWADNIRALGALAVNRPALDGPVVFARYHPGFMRELRAAFPDRQRWLYVTHRDAANDELRPYDETNLPGLERDTPRPPDNFDGYVIDGR